MTIIDTLIINRTGGYYNITDLNRVESAVKFLHDLLLEYGYSAKVVLRGAEWTYTDIPTVEDMNRYLNNIKELRETYAVLPTTPPLPPDMERLTFGSANSIEQILKDMYLLIAPMISIFIPTGAQHAYCGTGFYPISKPEGDDTERIIREVNDRLKAANALLYTRLYGSAPQDYTPTGTPGDIDTVLQEVNARLRATNAALLARLKGEI